jgi:RimJ/RimL family protein N-acetyltransferase
MTANMVMQPTLKTKRLILRPFTLVDAPDVQRLAGDKSIADTTINIPHPYEDGLAEKWIGTHREKFEKGELVNFAIVLREREILIGAIGLVISKRHEFAELGYWIGKPYWGNGYCTEAVKTVLEHGFTRLNLNRIHAYYMTRNPASGRVLEKAGMKCEGLLRGYVKKWGVFEDLRLFAILRSEYESKVRGGGKRHR